MRLLLGYGKKPAWRKGALHRMCRQRVEPFRKQGAMRPVLRNRKSVGWAALFTMRRKGINAFSCNKQPNPAAMTDVGEKIRNGLQKRQDALNRFRAKQEEFLLTRSEIKKDIEEARAIWKATVDQLPKQVFGD